MELFSMNIDKTAVYPDHVPYESTAPPLTVGHSPVNKFGPVSGDILANSPWSAIIHRPAEDSEPDDLPSTVDMDAIKEPPTPMPAPVLTPKPEPEPSPEPSGEESSSSSDSEADSSSESGGQSNTVSEEDSHSNSSWWSLCDKPQAQASSPVTAKSPSHSNSSSSSLSSSGHRSDSDHSTSHSQGKHFSIVRETNFDQGGLKLKISALKISKNPPAQEESSSSSSSSEERSNSSSDEEADKSSDASQGSCRSPRPRKQVSVPDSRKQTPPTPDVKRLSQNSEDEIPKAVKEETTVTRVTESLPKSTQKESEKKRVVEDKKEVITKSSRVTSDDSPVKMANVNTKQVKEETQSSSVRGSARIAKLRSETKSIKSPVKANCRTSEIVKNSRTSKVTSPVKNVEKSSASSTTRLRNFRRKSRAASQQQSKVGVFCGREKLNLPVEKDRG